MSLLFYKDEALTRPVTPASPVWILSSRRGASRYLSLWLADTYSALVTAAAAAGDTVFYVNDALGLAPAGSVIVDGVELEYVLSGLALTVSPLALPIAAGARAYPKVTYSGDTSLTMAPSGTGTLLLKRPEQSSYGIPNVSLLYPFSSAESAGLAGPLALARVDAQVRVAPGGDAEWADLLLITSLLSGAADSSLLQRGVAWFHVVRREPGLEQRFRLFPASRALADSPPGFVWGDYRWRDREEANAHALAPSEWDLDVDAIGREKFVAGFADGEDLEPLLLEKSQHSIRARVRPGTYFTGPERYYLPSDDSISAVGSGLRIPLGARPRVQRPLFVGAFAMDHEGYYDVMARYTHMFEGFQAPGPEYQFLFDRSSDTVVLNRQLSLGRLFLGVAPAAARATFDLPVHPVASVDRVLLGAYGVLGEEPVETYSVDYAAGTITLDLEESAAGRDLYVYCVPAVLVAAETRPAAPLDSVLLPADLNPAFAGTASGYLYLEHRKLRPAQLELYCDKPRILTPQSYAMVSGLVSFGPVFCENDFALLQVKASSLAGEPVSGARLEAVVAAPFHGALNYQDASVTAVAVTTGADGIASLIYTPPGAFGQYLALSSVSGTDVSLPAAIPLQQLWNVDEGWLARLYQVFNNDAFFGKVGGDPDYGEIVWAASGTAGTVGYHTNGRRVLWRDASLPLLPVEGLDIAGRGHLDPDFDGSVVLLRYAAPLVADAHVGSFFLTYVGRVSLHLQSPESGAVSNLILLDLQAPPEVVDESGVAGYLRLSAGGRLNINRLGGAPILPINVNTSRY